MTTPVRALYLGTGGGVFAAFHGADPGDATAVLLVPPFGWDDVTSYRPRRAWAQQLAALGHPTLRIDLPGTGDSAGGPDDPELVERWIDAVAAATAWLREHAQRPRVAVVGLGLGGLLALAASGRGAPLDDLVLWGTPARGRTAVRELRAFSRLEETNAPPAPPELGLVVNGHALRPATIDALGALDAADIAVPPGLRVLALDRDGIAADTKLVAALEGAGAHVDRRPGTGWGAMHDRPQDSVPSATVLAEIATWLRDGEGAAGAADPAAPVAPASADQAAPAAPASVDPAALAASASADQAAPAAPASVDPAAPATSASVDPAAPAAPATADANAPAATADPPALAAPAASDTLDLGIAVERPLVLAGPAGPTFGILTEPVGEPARQTVVLLNAGAIRRIGPNRMYVEAARRWAAGGIATLRLDVAGIGDADGDDTRWVDDSGFHLPELIDQVGEALAALADRGLPAPATLVGLCSGAHWAFQAALNDPRIDQIVLLNPRALFWQHDLAAARDLRHYLDRARSPVTWRRALRGDLSLRYPLQQAPGMLRRLARVILDRLARLRTPRAAAAATADHDHGDATDRALRQLADQGTRVLMAFVAEEPLYIELERDGQLERAAGLRGFEARRIGGDVVAHTLQPAVLQAEVHALLDAELGLEAHR